MKQTGAASESMTGKAYIRPPITEAVIGVQSLVVEDNDHEKGCAAVAKGYSNQAKIQSFQVQVSMSTFGPPGATTPAPAPTVTRFSNPEGSEIAVVGAGTFLVSQLPDYPGWPAFFARFKRDWKAWKKAVGYQKITRIGVRYINRIDVPMVGRVFEESELLNICVTSPDILGDKLFYSLTAAFKVADGLGKVLVNSGLVPSPLMNHAALLFDQDMYADTDVPQRDDDLFALLERFRVEKNMVFEACMSDKSRISFGLTQ